MPELRQDPITGRWVVLSPERLQRPLHFSQPDTPPMQDAENPFLEGNESYTPPEVFAIRENGSAPNTPGWKVRVVPNRFPALRVEGALLKEAEGIYDKISGVGAHEVVIETPRAGEELEDLELEDVAAVLKAYLSRVRDLQRDSRFRYLMIFKNVGASAGASIDHAHGQIIALPVTPIVIKEKLEAAREYYSRKERSIFNDILINEQKSGERLVESTEGYGVFCPYASRFPFESCIIPKTQRADFHRISDHELIQLADVLRRLLRSYRKALSRPSYNLVIHTAPMRYRRPGYWETIDEDFRWHIEILPRLSGIAGFEFGTGFFINPVYPEQAARTLREAMEK